MVNYVVIPVLNENKTIRKVANEAKKYAKVILVDDGSIDSTPAVLEKLKGVTVLTHTVNLGKGAALKTGYDYAMNSRATKIVMMDSDGQHLPKDIPRFFKTLSNFDAVFSYRQQRETMPFVLKAGNWGLSKLTRVLFGVKVLDSQCGFRGFTADAYKKIRWRCTNFEADNEMIASVGQKGISYTEIPINTLYLDRYKGTTVVSGLRLGLKMLMMKLRWY